MKTWLMALAFSRRAQLVTKAFTTNATVVIPIGVSRLEQAIGRGAAGQPGGTNWYMAMFYTDDFYDKASGEWSYGQRRYISRTDSYQGEPEPPPQSSVIVDNAIYRQVRTVEYFNLSETNEPTTGTAATGFGKTFPGGYAGPAPTSTYNNVVVTPGASYNIVVPAGGSVTITYYQ